VLGGSPLAPPAGLVPVAPLAPHSEVTQWHRHIVDDAARDEARVSWAYLPGVAQAAALALGGGEVPNPGYRHHELIEIAAERLYDRGVPIPWDYANADARPTSLPDREYAEVRASGDGRSVAGIKPRLVRERELAAAPPSAPGFTAHAESSCHGPHLQYRRPSAPVPACARRRLFIPHIAGCFSYRQREDSGTSPCAAAPGAVSSSAVRAAPVAATIPLGTGFLAVTAGLCASPSSGVLPALCGWQRWRSRHTDRGPPRRGSGPRSGQPALPSSGGPPPRPVRELPRIGGPHAGRRTWREASGGYSHCSCDAGQTAAVPRPIAGRPVPHGRRSQGRWQPQRLRGSRAGQPSAECLYLAAGTRRLPVAPPLRAPLRWHLHSRQDCPRRRGLPRRSIRPHGSGRPHRRHTRRADHPRHG
jgi:hypothetical protein